MRILQRILLGGFILSGSMACLAQENGNNDYQYALIEAVKQKNLGNLSEAVKLYRLVIENKPDCDVAYYELGSIYLMTGQVELAMGRLEQAYELDPGNQWYTMAYLNALGTGEKFDQMIEILNEKVDLDPDNAEWEYQLASVYFSEGRVKKSIRILNRIEKRRGFSEKITLLKASIYESEEKYELAREEVEKVMNLFPEALQFRIVAAELSMKNGEEDRAAAYYQEILDIDSTNIFALTNLTDYFRKREDFTTSFEYLTRSFQSPQIDVDRKVAIMSYYLTEDEFIEQHPGALDRLVQTFVSVHPDHPEGRLMAADFYIRSRDYSEAFKQLKIYLELQDGTYPIYMQAIILANASSLNEEMISLTGRALEQYPDSVDLRFFRGIGLYELGRYEQLVETFKGISMDQFSVKEYESQSKMLVAESYYRLGEYGKSDTMFVQLISDEPDNYMVLNNYSYYLAERGANLQQARQWSYRAIQNNPDNATFLDTYAWVLYKLKEYEEAERYILDALGKGGENDPEISEHAGDIQVALQSYEIALSYYMKAIILGGERERIEKKIEGIRQYTDE